MNILRRTCAQSSILIRLPVSLVLLQIASFASSAIMTGMTLTEYIRRRRLTLAAQDLQHRKTPIIDIAIKYGYDSAAAFSRAFAKQHGITPSVYRKDGGSLKVYSPASFHIMIKGAKEMDFRIIELADTVMYGVSKQYEGQGYKTREELRHSMWANNCDDVPGQLCEGGWNQPGSTSYDGVWYGIWQDGKYMMNQLSYPMHYCTESAIRLTYKAKQTRMFTDLIVFDECRYIYDWLPAIHQIPNAFSNPSWQYTFRFALDGLVKQRMNYNNEFFFQGSVVNKNEPLFCDKKFSNRIKIN